MSSSDDKALEKLIKTKRIELECEKLRLNVPVAAKTDNTTSKPPPKEIPNRLPLKNNHTSVHFEEDHSSTNDSTDVTQMGRYGQSQHSLLKTGEFSPNNPSMRGCGGHELFPGLGAYEERCGATRRERQKHYRRCLDQQAKKTPQKEEIRPMRSNRTSESGTQWNSPSIHEKFTENSSTHINNNSPSNGNFTADYGNRSNAPAENASRSNFTADYGSKINGTADYGNRMNGTADYGNRTNGTADYVSPRNGSAADEVFAAVSVAKRDACTQYEARIEPASIAVQTENLEVQELSSKQYSSLTRAERELSPRTVQESEYCHNVGSYDGRQDANIRSGMTSETQDRAREAEYASKDEQVGDKQWEGARRISKQQNSYLPSFLDAETIRRRNLKAEQEAAERRRFYQEELRNQIAEQRRIREERKAREKMLEEAEMRRLEEQLRMLRLAQQADNKDILTLKVNENALRTNYQNIDRQKVTSYHRPNKKTEIKQSKSDNSLKSHQKPEYNSTHYFNRNEKTYSSNIPESSMFSPSCDLENYLRRNLNPKPFPERLNYIRSDYVPSFLKKDIADLIVEEKRDLPVHDDLPIPVLRNSPKHKKSHSDHGGNIGSKSSLIQHNFDRNSNVRSNSKMQDYESYSLDRTPGANQNSRNGISKTDSNSGLSDAMRKIENKWKIPIVTKNIVRTVNTSEGSKNILTQLGSMRRQLQYEQLKLDSMLSDK